MEDTFRNRTSVSGSVLAEERVFGWSNSSLVPKTGAETGIILQYVSVPRELKVRVVGIQ